MPAPQINANATRYDPYKNYRYKVKWDGDYVAGFSKVGVLKRSTEVAHRAGGDPSLARLSPGQSTYDPITLEQGVTHDVTFEQWANKIWDYRNLKDFRKDITIELYNESGQKVLGYKVYRCWVSEFQALPEPDGSGNAAIAIQTLKLENEGWERDTGVTEPTETSFTLPAS
jgi:phage tail-like protein